MACKVHHQVRWVHGWLELSPAGGAGGSAPRSSELSRLSCWCREQCYSSLSSLLGHQMATRRGPPAERQKLAVGVMGRDRAPAALAICGG